MNKLIFLLLTTFAFSQEISLKSKISNDSIPFATIHFIKSGKMTHFDYANKNGTFDLPKQIEFDSIKISCIGFYEKWISKPIETTIFLDEKVEELKEIVLSYNKKSEFLIGELSKKRKKNLISTIGKTSWTKFFPNEKKKKYILKSIILDLEKINFKTAIGLKFYNKTELKKEVINYKDNNKKIITSYIVPNEEITAKNIYYFVEKNESGKIEIDVSDLDFEIPLEGVFVSIFLLDYYDDNGKEIDVKNNNLMTRIFLNKTRDEFYCVKNFLPDGTIEWINLNNSSKCNELYFHKNLTPYYVNFIEPTFAIKVVELED